MKGKKAKTAIFLIMVIALLLGCKDAFHDKDDSAPVIPDGKSYTVSFDANKGSGTAPSPIPAKSGESIRLPNAGDLSRTKYTFEGWNTNASGTGTNYSAGEEFTVPTRNVTLYAKWEAAGSSAVSVTGVSLDKPSLSLTVGGSETLTATVSPSNATNKSVNWASSNPSVATVSGGTVSAVSAGSATITVSTVDGGKMATCSVTVSSSGGSGTGGIDSVSGLANKWDWVMYNAKNGDSYTIEVSSNESIRSLSLNPAYYGKNNITITLKGIGSNRTISLTSDSTSVTTMFIIDKGGTLVLDNNITLQGVSDTERSLIMVASGGTLKMNQGSVITNNEGRTEYMESNGLGVYVTGTFIMNGGTISNNSASYGGGVYVREIGTFTMNGGTISNNKAKYNGGGVYVSKGGTFNNNYPSGIYGNTPDNVYQSK